MWKKWIKKAWNIGGSPGFLGGYLNVDSVIIYEEFYRVPLKNKKNF